MPVAAAAAAAAAKVAAKQAAAAAAKQAAASAAKGGAKAAVNVSMSKESVKGFQKGFSDLKDFGDDGADKMKSAFDSMTGTLGVISPLMGPLALISSQITTETAATSMATMKQIIAMIQTDTFQVGMGLLINLINLFLGRVGEMSNTVVLFDLIMKSAIEKITFIGTTLKTTIDIILDQIMRVPIGFQNLAETVKLKIDGVVMAIPNAIQVAGDFLEEKLETIKTTITAPFVEIGEKIDEIGIKINTTIDSLNILNL